MKEVVVTKTIEAPREAVERVLSPTAIVDYVGTYLVRDVEETDGTVLVQGTNSQLDATFEFTETDVGYVYEQRDGPFKAMFSSVAITDEEPVVVTARSCYTFGLPFPRLSDWLVSRERKLELRRLLDGIETEATRVD